MTKSVFDERRAQTGRQINALHFAAAQRASRSIEREIAETNLAKILQTGTNLLGEASPRWNRQAESRCR